MGFRIIALTGPSGVGKGYLRSRLAEQRPQLIQLTFVSTRPPRESDGSDLVSGMTKSAFEKHHAAGRIGLIVEPHDGPQYGMWLPSLEVARRLDCACITEVHPTQVAAWREQLAPLHIVGLVAKDHHLRENLQLRGEPEFATRLAAAAHERKALVENHDAGHLDELVSIRSRDVREWEVLVARLVRSYLS